MFSWLVFFEEGFYFSGMVTGMRGLCNGLGPAMFGIIFYMFHVDLNEGENQNATHSTQTLESYTEVRIEFM